SKSAADVCVHERDKEHTTPVINSAAHRQREWPQIPVPGRDGQAASHHHNEPYGQRRKHAEADMCTAARRAPDNEDPAPAGHGGGDSREDDPGLPRAPGALNARPPPQNPEDQDGQNQITYQDRLYERETSETERHHL